MKIFRRTAIVFACLNLNAFLLESRICAEEPASPSSQLVILAEEEPNITAWLTAPLNAAISGDIRQNLTFMREALLDEGKQKPIASTEAYSLGYRLLNSMIAALDERDAALIKAGYTAAQINTKTGVTSQALEARRNFKMSWPQYVREQDQREELQKGANSNVALQKEQIKVDWADKTIKLRKNLDILYAQYRDALRQQVLPEKIIMRPTATSPAGVPATDAKPDSAQTTTRVSKGEYYCTSFAGHKHKELFEEVGAKGGILVGFDVLVTPFKDSKEVVRGMAPIFLTPEGEQKGECHGAKKGNSTKHVAAKPGYAVGALTAQFDGMALRRIKVRFDRISGTGLDTKDSYETDWVGVYKDCKESKADTEGKLPVGITGSSGGGVDGLGILCLKR